MLSIDYTLIIQIANFLFLLFILNILLYKPIRQILRQRKEEIDSFVGMIGEFVHKSDQSKKTLEENKVEAKKEGLKEKEALKSEGSDQERNMLSGATSEASGKVDQAREEIAASLVSARQTLEKEVALFSRELAQKILGRSV
ncbi:MAG: ATPase [Deltaproteobacteria bacterium]